MVTDAEVLELLHDLRERRDRMLRVRANLRAELIELVDLGFRAGLTMSEMARAVGVTPRTIRLIARRNKIP